MANNANATNKNSQTPPATQPPPPTQSNKKTAIGQFIYIGPTVPGGRLKHNAVFRGTQKQLFEHFAEEIKRFPEVEKLLVPVTVLGRMPKIYNVYYKRIAEAILKEGG